MGKLSVDTLAIFFSQSALAMAKTTQPLHLLSICVGTIIIIALEVQLSSLIWRGIRFEQTMKLGGQVLFMNNALPLLSIVQAKRGAAPEFN